MEKNLDATRVELKRDVGRVEKNLDATRVELKRELVDTRVELKSQAHDVESRLSHQIERLGDRSPTVVPLDARVKQPD